MKLGTKDSPLLEYGSGWAYLGNIVGQALESWRQEDHYFDPGLHDDTLVSFHSGLKVTGGPHISCDTRHTAVTTVQVGCPCVIISHKQFLKID